MTRTEMKEKLIAKFGKNHPNIEKFNRICKNNPKGSWLVLHLFKVLMGEEK